MGIGQLEVGRIAVEYDPRPGDVHPEERLLKSIKWPGKELLLNVLILEIQVIHPAFIVSGNLDVYRRFGRPAREPIAILDLTRALAQQDPLVAVTPFALLDLHLDPLF